MAAREFAVAIVGMTQVVLGAAFGYIIGQGVLHTLKHLIAYLQRDDVRGRIRPSDGVALVGGFIKYSGVIATIGALVTLGVWAVKDYLATGPARNLSTSSSNAQASAHSHPDHLAALAPESQPQHDSSLTTAPDKGDPYTDPDFVVHRRMHPKGGPASLKETLVQRSEAKAANELLAQTKEHMHRSQYDCEAAERVSRYLQAGLDVWGFATWQVKYFPPDGYKGATLEQCKGIEPVVFPQHGT